MEQVFPDYYTDFSCAASKCSHNCCIGWEIDIDSDTMSLYRSVKGEFGERLQKSIAEGEEPHFILERGERCPFLNGENLCDIILNLGEADLCQICTDHPRFRNFLPGRTETGLGMCCEEAAKLILSRSEPEKLVVTGEKEETDKESEKLIELRELVFSALSRKTLPIIRRAENVLSLCGAKLPEKNLEQWARLYLSLERMDQAWTKLLEELRDRHSEIDFSGFDRFITPRIEEYARLLSYFVFRHFTEALDDGDVQSKAGFAVLSYKIIYALGALKWTLSRRFSFEDQVELARLYSSEIEYSQENMDQLYDELCS